MFDGFRLEQVRLGDVTLRFRHGGSGTPVVLLHGHPLTHTTWHEVAARLAGHHRVVTPDLRGYGGSTLPPDEPDHAQSSKRAMAHDVIRLIAHLGHERFAVAGHDRGLRRGAGEPGVPAVVPRDEERGRGLRHLHRLLRGLRRGHLGAYLRPSARRV